MLRRNAGICIRRASKKTGAKRKRGNGNRRVLNVDPYDGWWSRSIHSQNFWDTQFSYVMTHDIRLHCNILYRVPLIYLFIGFFSSSVASIVDEDRRGNDIFLFQTNQRESLIHKETHAYNKSSGIDCVNILLFRSRWRRPQSLPLAHNKIEGGRQNCNIARRISLAFTIIKMSFIYVNQWCGFVTFYRHGIDFLLRVKPLTDFGQTTRTRITYGIMQTHLQITIRLYVNKIPCLHNYNSISFGDWATTCRVTHN